MIPWAASQVRSLRRSRLRPRPHGIATATASSTPTTMVWPILRLRRVGRGGRGVEGPPPAPRRGPILMGRGGARQKFPIPGNPGGASKPLLDPKLIEATRHGAIPKIGPDGVRPSTRYARPRDLPANKKDSPLIAIVIGGLGISASGTADAFAKLPATVTFALTPYGT